MHEMRSYSDATAHQVDQEIQRVLFAASDRATDLLKEHRDKLDSLAEKLTENEIVDSDELETLFGPRP